MFRLELDGGAFFGGDPLHFLDHDYCKGSGKHGSFTARFCSFSFRGFDRGGYFSDRHDGDADQFWDDGSGQLAGDRGEPAQADGIFCECGGGGISFGPWADSDGESDPNGGGSFDHRVRVNFWRGYFGREVGVQRGIRSFLSGGGPGGGQRGQPNRANGGSGEGSL